MKPRKKKFLEVLRTSVNVLSACDKMPISRSTVYKWREDDPEFRRLMDEAANEGEAHALDMVEEQIAKRAQEGDLGAGKFFLSHRNPKFKRGVTSATDGRAQEGLTPEEEAIVNRAIALSAGTTNV